MADAASTAAMNRGASAQAVDLTPCLAALAQAIQAEPDPNVQQMLAEAGQLITQAQQAQTAGNGPAQGGPPALNGGPGGPPAGVGAGLG